MDKDKGILEIIFQVKGEGTKILSEKNEGTEVDVVGPLGQGTFNYENYKNISIIGGGIGAFPLYELGKCAKNADINVSTYLGYRNKDFIILENEFKQISNKLIVTTDDGSNGKKGFAIDYLKQDIESENTDCIFACRPYTYVKGSTKISNRKKYKLSNIT